MTTLKTMIQHIPALDPFEDNMPSYARKIQDNETPFKAISFGIYTIKLYWTTNRGAYGYQVIAILFARGGFCHALRTNGCGYCKESHAMETIWRAIGYHPRLNSYLHDTINYRYHVGGNYYKVPVKDILKNKRGA